MKNIKFLEIRKKSLIITILLTVLTSLFLLWCSSSDGSNYQIDATITGVSGKVYLYKYVGKEPTLLDSCEALDSKISFNNKLEVPFYGKIVLAKSPKKELNLFVDYNPVTIQGTLKNIDKSEVTSPANLLDKRYIQQKDSIYSLEKIQATDKEALFKKALLEFVKANNTSVVASYRLFRDSYMMSYEEIKECREFLKVSENCSYLKLIDIRIEALKKTNIGESYLNFTCKSIDGSEFELSSIVGEKYIYIDFWASWCRPCIDKRPMMQKAFKNYKDKLNIVSVSLDSETQAWQGGVKKYNMDWINVSEVNKWNSSVARLWGVQSIPTAFLIDKEGKIICKNPDLKDLASLVK